ncbi:MAG: protein-L-isoaspartate(D-aspartate) O-methyltransferase [Candidatus Nanoarchaeia archaeon]
MSSEKKALIEYWKATGLVTNEKVLKAIEKVPRENFVLPKYKEFAYLDEPLPLFSEQTISQPTTVAIMTDALEVKPGQKVLEIGTGSGYQAAILSELVGPKGKIITIERIKKLVDFARKNLKNYKNVKIIHADGTKGYLREAPYDRIIVTASASELPNTLFAQLKEKGIMVIPLEDHLFKITKIKGNPMYKDLGLFLFVPLLKGKV